MSIDQASDNKKNIVIYGAGSVARKLINDLKHADQFHRVSCIAVRDIASNPSEIAGIPVMSVWDMDDILHNSLIIIATKPEFRDSVVRTLESMEISAYIDVSDFYGNFLEKETEPSGNLQERGSVRNIYKKIVFYAYRTCNNGKSGGPGTSLYLQETVLGDSFEGIDTEYHYKPETIFYRKLKGEFFGAFLQVLTETIFQRKVFYVSNDIGTAYALALLRKPYILVFHHQGPFIKECLDYGQRLSDKRLKRLHKIERKAFVNAGQVLFPSRGAANMYFGDENRSAERDEVTVGKPLYNTIIPPKQTRHIAKDEDAVTFLSLGTVSSAKGQDLSIEFIAKYLECYKGKVRYIVIGRGPLLEQVNQRARELMKQYPNFEYIYISWVESHSEIIRIHELSDIYIMLHRISIFDLSTLEAMRAQSVLVLSDVGGNSEFNVEDNVVIVRNQDYSSAVNDLLVRDMNELKSRNKKVFDNYFSEAAFLNSYTEVLEEALKS